MPDASLSPADAGDPVLQRLGGGEMGYTTVPRLPRLRARQAGRHGLIYGLFLARPKTMHTSVTTQTLHQSDIYVDINIAIERSLFK